MSQDVVTGLDLPGNGPPLPAKTGDVASWIQKPRHVARETRSSQWVRPSVSRSRPQDHPWGWSRTEASELEQPLRSPLRKTAPRRRFRCRRGRHQLFRPGWAASASANSEEEKVT